MDKKWFAWGVVTVLAVAHGASLAQTASTPAATQAAGTTRAADADAMARAQRAAANPLRVILEAGKIRRRVDPEPTTDAPAASPRRLGIRTQAAQGTRATGATAVSAAPVTSAGAASEASPERLIRVIPALPSDLAGAPAVKQSALERFVPAGVAAPPAGPSALPAVGARLESAASKPRLVYVVEPEVPDNLVDLTTRGSIAAEFLIRADGSVTQVHLLPPAPQQLLPTVARALEQWRYEPLPAQRRHLVQLELVSSAR